jgi:hypothetical protein
MTISIFLVSRYTSAPPPPPLDSTHGWFGGGRTAPGISTQTSIVDRINFAADTSTSSSRGPLSQAKNGLAAVSTEVYGWFGGGGNFSSQFDRVDRITFAADTATASIRGPLSLARTNLAATGNNNFGWFGGGQIPAPAGGPRSLVDRISFASDTNTASTRGSLSVSMTLRGATGNNNFGWFGGGYTTFPSAFSLVDRIIFASDTAVATTRGPLSQARSSLSGVNDNQYGWFGGGTSRVDRITFIDDTITASTRGPLSLAREVGAAGNNTFGWFAGQQIPGVAGTLIDRITFAADTGTASVRGPLSSGRYSIAGTSGVL